VLALWPAALAGLVYDREAILHGEIWRLYTGHFVHFGVNHLWWNLVAVLLAGCWLQWSRSGTVCWYAWSAPIILSLVLLGLEPDLKIYAGLSGVSTGMVTLVGLKLAQGPPRDRWSGVVVLGMVAIKTIRDWTDSTPMWVDFSDEHIRTVPLVHLAGAVWALLVAAIQLMIRRKPPEQSAAERV